MQQLSLQLDLPQSSQNGKQLLDGAFSHQGVSAESERVALEEKYADLLVETDKFSRRLVSFQANKTETLHGWIKYREGFSAQLVEILLSEFNLQPGQTLLEPFAGSCTSLLVAKMNGIDAVGIELLPHCHLAWEAKANVFAYDLAELEGVRNELRRTTPPGTDVPFPHLTITESAFPPDGERDIVDYALWFDALSVSRASKTLCRAVLMSILEDVSYTRKDGQYLRWDVRADKLIRRHQAKDAASVAPIRGIHKGELPTVKQSLVRKLDAVVRDIHELQQQPPPSSRQQLLKGNSLYVLPELQPDQFDGVITSPPYANRYDYTRTYALELAFLNVDRDIFRLRQELLSCTVENRPKLADLQDFYTGIGRGADYQRIAQIIHTHPVLNEVSHALQVRNARGDINNRGVLGMIDQYFAELTFIYAELFRTCRPGAHVAFVNDNVRYAGEVIPVDLISTSLAEWIGFKAKQIYVLPQRKGNSSQQMGKFGRRELRKSIAIWQKP